MLAVGCTESNSNNQENVSTNTQPSNLYHDSEWAKRVSESTLLFDNETAEISKAINDKDYRTALGAFDRYKQDIDKEIRNTDNLTISPALQTCQDEYRLGLLNDYNAATFMRSGIDQLMSGNLVNSVSTINLGADELRSANGHYGNATLLLKAYNTAHQDSQFNIEFMRHNIDSKESKSSSVSSSTQTSSPKTKTLADKELEYNEPHSSETTNENSNSLISSSHSIFDYCTWQAQLTKKIGEYNKAPEGKNYVVVTIKINNTGDETYTTNPYSWHLKIGDVYYQHDTATYDTSMNQLTTDIAPGGKITTKIAYLVDGEPSISDIQMYYDGPGSEGTINS